MHTSSSARRLKASKPTRPSQKVLPPFSYPGRAEHLPYTVEASPDCGQWTTSGVTYPTVSSWHEHACYLSGTEPPSITVQMAALRRGPCPIAESGICGTSVSMYGPWTYEATGLPSWTLRYLCGDLIGLLGHGCPGDDETNASSVGHLIQASASVLPL